VSWNDYDPEEDRQDLDRVAAGYECKECGYQPTYRELRRGACPDCSVAREIKVRSKAKEKK
jgi:DNA-directed RNA polymerase subunit RPC12/RpoP